MDLENLRKLVRLYIDRHQYHSALFWADKVVSISKNNVSDVFWFAQCLFLTKQYHRAAHVIKSRNLHKTDLNCKYLAAKCHYEGKEYKEAMEILDLNENGAPKSPNASIKLEKSTEEIDERSDGNKIPNLESAIHLLRGQIQEMLDNRCFASTCFQKALELDVYCYEAFYSLIQHQMLSKDEEKQLMSSLAFDKQCLPDEGSTVKSLYELQLKKYDKPEDLKIPFQLGTLEESLDVLTALAERCYYSCDYQQCFQITSKVLSSDPFHLQCIPIHISCLMELKKSSLLFYLAHKLVDLYPESAIAWFAVGCYYLLINKTDSARRYLSKATVLDRVFGPAWLVYGHSFAVENEHDQAMAAYFKASQLMKGCHLPLLYIGLEYGLTNNTKLAERFFTQALTVAPEDPFVLHELGVVAYHNQDYLTAEKYFRDSLVKVQSIGQAVLPEKWEPLLNNLGHVCRKLKKFEEALDFHQQALVLVSQNPTTFSALGYIYSLLGQWALAVEYFHKALGLHRDDTFSTTMLGHVIEHLINEMPPCDDVPTELPSYKLARDASTDASLDVTPLDATSDEPSLSMDMEM